MLAEMLMPHLIFACRRNTVGADVNRALPEVCGECPRITRDASIERWSGADVTQKKLTRGDQLDVSTGAKKNECDGARHVLPRAYDRCDGKLISVRQRC
jgi:hypothetical protein